MDTQDNILTIREYPWGEWAFGLLMFAIAAFSAESARGDWSISLIAGVAGLLFILFGTFLVIQADRSGATLMIRRSSLLRRYERVIPVADISGIQLEASQGSSSTYRIVVVTKENEVIPFRPVYSSGKLIKEARVKKLRAFLDVGGADLSAGGIFSQATQMAQQAFQQKQEALTGPEAEEHISEGVHWKTQTIAFGGRAVTRWFSPDQQCAGGFVFLAQKVSGQAAAAGGLLGGMNKFIYHELMGLYGFTGEDTPGLDSAVLLAAFDPQLDPYFSVYTSDPQAARQTLAWSVAPLADWASRYPLKTVQTSGQLFGQLVVMICPRGTYVASMGNMIPEAMQELINLGVALVKGK